MTGAHSRRDVLKAATAGAAAAMLPMPALAQNAPARVVVVGGGFSGATCARMLKRLDPSIAVTLVEANQTFTACPFSNEVIAGLRDIKAQQFDYKKIADDKVVVAVDDDVEIEPADDPFLEEEEEDSDDVGDLIDGEIGDEEER